MRGILFFYFWKNKKREYRYYVNLSFSETISRLRLTKIVKNTLQTLTFLKPCKWQLHYFVYFFLRK